MSFALSVCQKMSEISSINAISFSPSAGSADFLA
jgi:hypothetical protein